MKRAFTLIEVLIVVVAIAIIAAILWPVFAQRLEPDRRNRGCQLNLKQIGLGFLQYVQDADEKFPPARVTPTIGWADVLQPYVKSRQLFNCPMTQQGSQSTSDYFYNRFLARLKSDRIDEPSKALLSGDGEDDGATWNSWGKLPADAATNSNSPLQRHVGGAEYLFGDGHVKWIKPQDINSWGTWNPRLF